MKYIKKFEQNDDIAFSVGDIVMSIHPQFAKIGTKFKVQNIFYYNHNNFGNFGSKVYIETLPESKHNKEHFVDLLSLEDSKIYSGIWSTRFMTELKYNTGKYNL